MSRQPQTARATLWNAPGFATGVCVASAIAVAWPASVVAQQRVRVAVAEATGPQSQQIAAHVERALRNAGEVEVVSTRGGGAPSGASERVALARQEELNTLISVRVTRDRQFDATVTVYDGQNGEQLAEDTWSDKRAAKLNVIVRQLWSRLGDAIRQGQRPGPLTASAPRNTAAATHDDPSAGDVAEADIAHDDETGVDSSPRPPALIADLAIGPMWRNQSYNDTLREVPFHYYNELTSPALWVSAAVAFYPVALTSSSLLGHFGLVGSFGMAVGLDSKDDAGNSISTSASTFHVGLRTRIPISDSELGLTVGYGGRSFSTDAPATTPIPDVSHRFVRIAGDGAIALTPSLSLQPTFAYLARLSTGELEDDDYFPELSGGGIEMGLAAALKLGDSGLSLRVSVDWQRFYFTLNPALNAARVAGGAVDNYYTVTVGARYALTTK